MVSVFELLETCFTISFCCASSSASWARGMVGWGGSDGSMDALSFERATDDGSVSGSKSASRIRLSFVLRAVLGISIAMVDHGG